MKRIFIFLLFLLSSLNSFTQNFEWAYAINCVTNPGVFEQGRGITTDIFGDVLITGIYGGTGDFDPGSGVFNLTCGTVGGCGIFIKKIDANKNLIWAKSFCGVPGSAGTGLSIITDSLGNVYVTGHFTDTIDFDPGPGTFNLTSSVFQDIFILKLDSAGDFIWAKSIGANSQNFGRSITIDNNGNVLVTGFFNGVTDFDPGVGIFNLIGLGNWDTFILKLDSAGNFIWAKSTTSPTSYNEAYCLKTDNQNNVYITGLFEGTVDFDPDTGVTNVTSFDVGIFILKLDSNGNFIWVKQIDGPQVDVGYSLTLDNFGSLYITGYYESTVDFDPGLGIFNLTATMFSDVFILKLDLNGEFIWAKSLGCVSARATDITTDVSGNIYFTGHFAGFADFDPGAGNYNATAIGSFDIFVEKIDSNGNFLWAKIMGGIGNDNAYSITIDGANNVFTTGAFSDTVDFNPGGGIFQLTANFNTDIFVHKLGSLVGIQDGETEVGFEIYPNPTTGLIQIKNLQQTYNLKNHHITISNIYGTIIKKIQLEEAQKEFDISDINTGIYLLTIKNKKNEPIYLSKIIKL